MEMARRRPIEEVEEHGTGHVEERVVVLFRVDAKKRRRDRGGLGPRNTRREK